MAGPPPPYGPLPYHLLHRGGRPGAWRPFVGVLVLVASFLVVVPVLLQLPFAVLLLLLGRDVVPGMERLLRLDDPTPMGLAYLNLTLASAILVTWAITRVVHGLRPGWLASVRPRIRWRWFATCLGLSLLALVATLVVSAAVPSQGDGTRVGGGLNTVTATTAQFALVVLLLTPLQAAGEEYAFRGYLTQAFGGVFGRTAGVVLPAVLFALAHGAQSPPVFFDRLAFGLVAGVAVVVTGGLEAGIAMHVLNNWLAFGLALAYGDIASSLNPSGGSWWTIPVTLTQSLVYLGLVVLVARRRGLATTTSQPVAPGVLVAGSRAV